MRRSAALIVLALLAAPASGQAQRFEITPFGGWRFGGGLVIAL